MARWFCLLILFWEWVDTSGVCRGRVIAGIFSDGYEVLVREVQEFGVTCYRIFTDFGRDLGFLVVFIERCFVFRFSTTLRVEVNFYGAHRFRAFRSLWGGDYHLVERFRGARGFPGNSGYIRVFGLEFVYLDCFLAGGHCVRVFLFDLACWSRK